MKGSEWNKWDMHLHSPMTWLANGYTGNCDTEAFVRKLGEQRLSLIGLTNYFYFCENELEIIRDEIARQGLKTTVLGNVEFRLDQQNKEGQYINIHVLFSERLSTTRINEILSKLPLKITDGSGRNVYCCEKDVKASGLRVDTIVVDLSQLLEHLSSTLSPFREFIVAVCPNGYGGYRPNATGRSQTMATWIDRKGHIIFGNQRDRDYFLTNTRYDGALVKPVFHCSDAHKVETIGSAFTWVKAKPTFEGLRQAILEPEGRLQLDADWLNKRIPKAHFSRIDVEGTIFDGQSIRFRKRSIPLNQDMVAIIGGRGTGKSLLLDALRSRFGGAAALGSDERQVSVENLSIELDKANGEKVLFDVRTDSYDYLHVSQGEIKTLCQQPGLISNEIKKMLRLSDNEVANELRTALDENLNAYCAFREYYGARDERQNLINTREHQAEIIRIAQEKINTLTSEKNKALIERFKVNSLRATALQQALGAGRAFMRETETAEATLNLRLTEMNAVPSGIVPVPPLDLSEHKNRVAAYMEALLNQLTLTDDDNRKITVEFRAQGIEQDITGVLDKIQDYQREIQHAQLRDGEIFQRITQYSSELQQRCTLSEAYVRRVLQQKSSIDASFAALAEKPHLTPDQQALISEILTDISIYGQPHFNISAFYKGILERLNRGRFRTAGEQSGIEKLTQVLGVRGIEDFIALIRGNAIIETPEEPGKKITLEDFLWKSEFFNSQGSYALQRFIYSPEHISSYLTVRAGFEYKGKTVEKLSAGQRGTFYVCLKLATDAFGSPFVFDQPEDDLDNDFIMRQLVPLFRKIKQYRQVIIVTHNANLVVNCDAEQVIVASNEDEVISYRSGALEYGEEGHDNSMRKAICDVLEGGRLAFESREQKYGMR